MQLSLSAFLASAAGSSDLVHHILPSHLKNAPLSNVSDAVALWSQGHDHFPPVDPATHHQKAWDNHKVSAMVNTLLESVPGATASNWDNTSVLCKRCSLFVVSFK